MTQSQHTQGPWVLSRVCRTDNGGSRYNVKSKETGEFIQTLVIETGIDEANAHLIAAAPELLEALEGLYSLQTCFPQRNPIVAKALEKASAALNKAKGGL